MSKFHLGLTIGFFLGTLAMFLVMGIIHLYLEERQQENIAVRKRFRGLQDLGGILPSADDELPDTCPAPKYRKWN